MQSLTARRPAARVRRDPAPSKWDYRLQRWMLTPYVRSFVVKGIPTLVVLGAAGTSYNDRAWLHLVNTLIGTLVGALAGFYRGWVDTVLMRFTDSVITRASDDSIITNTTDLYDFGMPTRDQ